MDIEIHLTLGKINPVTTRVSTQPVEHGAEPGKCRAHRSETQVSACYNSKMMAKSCQEHEPTLLHAELSGHQFVCSDLSEWEILMCSCTVTNFHSTLFEYTLLPISVRIVAGLFRWCNSSEQILARNKALSARPPDKTTSREQDFVTRCSLSPVMSKTTT